MDTEFHRNVQAATLTEGLGPIAVVTTDDFGVRRNFNVVTDGAKVVYRILDAKRNHWEIVVGIWDKSASTLTRDELVESSSGSAVNFEKGRKELDLLQSTDPASWPFRGGRPQGV